MRVDLRWRIIGDRPAFLQWRTGVEFQAGNPKYDKHSDKPGTGKYRTEVKWGKWKEVRTERFLMPTSPTPYGRGEGES